MSSLASRSVVAHFFSLSRPSPFLHVILLRLSSSWTNSSSSPTQGASYRRQQEEESRSVRVSVWWDIENCAVPVGANVFKVAHYITTAVRSCGIKGPVQITAFGDVFHLPRAKQEALSATGINLTHVPGGGRNSADRSLLVDLLCWVSQNPPPAHLFLISGDSDFAVILHRLRMSNYNILLACREGTPTALCSAASIMWHWNALVKGENLSGRYFNQPPDGPYHSWYGHYKVAPAPNSRRAADESSDNGTGTDSKPLPVPKDVVRKIQSIVNSHPDGIKITDLRSELSKENVVFDKEFYGHGKFSSLLLSMPHVCKLSGHDGQFFLSPVVSGVSEGTAWENQEPVSSSSWRNEGQSVSSAMDMAQSSSSGVQITSNMTTADAPSTNVPPASLGVDVGHSEKPVKSGKDTEKHDVAVNSGENSETLPRNGAGILNSPVSLLAEGSEQPKSEEMVLEEKRTDYSVIEDHNAMKEQSVGTSGEILEDPATMAEQQDPAPKVGFFRRLWNKWFGKKNVEPRKTKHELSDKVLDSISIDKVSNAEERHSNSSIEFVGDLALSSSGRNNSFDAKSSTVSNQMDYSKGDELFLMDSFWSEIESFLKSKEGSQIILNSMTREDIAENLRKEGPLVIHPLDECDLLKLVDVLISEKKLIEECHLQSPPFRVSQSSRSDSKLPNSSRLRSIFLEMTTSQSKTVGHPERESTGVNSPSSTKNKPYCERSKDEVFADCKKLLNDLLKETPQGVNIGYFKERFLERYGYTLDYKKFGFKRLTSLLQTVCGAQVEPNYVVPNYDIAADRNIGSSKQLSESKYTRWEGEPLLRGKNNESPWEEQLGPGENIDPCRRDNSNRGDDGEYELPPLSDDDDGLSDSEEELTSPSAKEDVQRKARATNEEVSSLLEVLGDWGASREKNDEISRTCSRHGNAPIRFERKYRPVRSYSFVSNSDDKDKLIDTKLGSLKKASGDSGRMQG